MRDRQADLEVRNIWSYRLKSLLDFYLAFGLLEFGFPLFMLYALLLYSLLSKLLPSSNPCSSLALESIVFENCFIVEASALSAIWSVS